MLHDFLTNYIIVLGIWFGAGLVTAAFWWLFFRNLP